MTNINLESATKELFLRERNRYLSGNKIAPTDTLHFQLTDSGREKILSGIDTKELKRGIDYIFEVVTMSEALRHKYAGFSLESY